MRGRFGGICECGNHAWAKLTRGFVCLVSPEDAEIVKRRAFTTITPLGLHSRTVYAYRQILVAGKKTQIYLHNEIAGRRDGFEVDHENFDGLDCRRPNLRHLTPTANRKHVRPKRARKK